MWTLLPVVAFGSAFVPEVASFIAGQAAFTMMVLIIFNLIAPTGWSVGLVRVEDVVIGALVGVLVSVLLWPRGAGVRVAKAIDDAAAVGAEFLKAAVFRVTRGASEDATDRVTALGNLALGATRTVDDAVRHYLSESSGAADVRAPVVRAANRATRLRAAAELIADVVPPPLTAYRQTCAVLEDHAEAVATLLTSHRKRPQPRPISDAFVTALRAEADEGGMRNERHELSVAAALPLVTVAAHLGELELLYPSGNADGGAAAALKRASSTDSDRGRVESDERR
jgi:uncharacterized membrane protein YccC